MSKLTNPEEVLREVIWYGAHRYDDKPAQFWNRMRIAAETLGDTEAASIFAAYCENGCPLTREQEQSERVMKNRDEVLNEFVERIVDGMDMEEIVSYAIDKMRESYDDVSDEDLAKEIADYYPDLLED